MQDPRFLIPLRVMAPLNNCRAILLADLCMLIFFYMFIRPTTWMKNDRYVCWRVFEMVDALLLRAGDVNQSTLLHIRTHLVAF